MAHRVVQQVSIQAIYFKDDDPPDLLTAIGLFRGISVRRAQRGRPPEQKGQYGKKQQRHLLGFALTEGIAKMLRGAVAMPETVLARTEGARL